MDIEIDLDRPTGNREVPSLRSGDVKAEERRLPTDDHELSLLGRQWIHFANDDAEHAVSATNLETRERCRHVSGLAHAAARWVVCAVKTVVV